MPKDLEKSLKTLEKLHKEVTVDSLLETKKKYKVNRKEYEAIEVVISLLRDLI